MTQIMSQKKDLLCGGIADGTGEIVEGAHVLDGVLVQVDRAERVHHPLQVAHLDRELAAAVVEILELLPRKVLQWRLAVLVIELADALEAETKPIE